MTSNVGGIGEGSARDAWPVGSNSVEGKFVKFGWDITGI